MKWEYLHPADRPVVDGLEKHEVVYAKDQPEYIPLRCLRANTGMREVLSRWTLTPEQRKMVAEGADIFLELSTFGGPLQPIRIQVSADPEPWFFEQRYKLQLACGCFEEMANFRLVSAAPELLEAAEDVLEQYRKSVVPIGPDLSDSIRVLLADAVRKAKRV